MRHLEVLFTPAEFAALKRRDLSHTACVVFDILRATTSMMTALANGASAIQPVAEISEALAARQRQPGVLLAGERDGLRIRGELTGGVDFDLGNSPREFTAGRVHGKTLVMTTTNGTRALQACAHAQTVLIGSFLGLRAVAEWLRAHPSENVLLVCAGTHEEAAFEDTLAAGALGELLVGQFVEAKLADSVEIARQIFAAHRGDLLAAMKYSHNGRRLLALPELAADVPVCLQIDALNFVAAQGQDGLVRRIH